MGYISKKVAAYGQFVLVRISGTSGLSESKIEIIENGIPIRDTFM